MRHAYGKLKELQHSFNDDRAKPEKRAKKVQLLQKELKLEKSEITAAENSTCLNSDSFEINTGKLQDGNIDSGGSSLKNVRVIMIQHEDKK